MSNLSIFERNIIFCLADDGAERMFLELRDRLSPAKAEVYAYSWLSVSKFLERFVSDMTLREFMFQRAKHLFLAQAREQA